MQLANYVQVASGVCQQTWNQPPSDLQCVGVVEEQSPKLLYKAHFRDKT
jgi:hypothetical protein